MITSSESIHIQFNRLKENKLLKLLVEGPSLFLLDSKSNQSDKSKKSSKPKIKS